MVKKDSVSAPSPTIKEMPEWFRKADRFAINPMTKDYWLDQEGGKIPTWKACPALFDVLTTGYVLRTPCDLKFYLKIQK